MSAFVRERVPATARASRARAGVTGSPSNPAVLSDLSPELVLVLPPELRELALASLPAQAPFEFLSFRGIPPPASVPQAAAGDGQLAIAVLAYTARSAFGMLMVGVSVIAGIVALVLGLQLVH